MNIFEQKNYLCRINTKRLAKTILFYDKIDSTNKKAKSLAKEAPLKEGTTLVASQQTEGKGTDGNQWQSYKGNLYISVIFPFDERITTLFPLYPAVALCQVLREKYKINAHVKWPNDVLVGTHKIAGILCEGVSGSYMIMGIGIKVLQKDFEGEVKNIATSIALETKQTFTIEQVFQHFLESYEKLFYNNCNICE